MKWIFIKYLSLSFWRKFEWKQIFGFSEIKLYLFVENMNKMNLRSIKYVTMQLISDNSLLATRPRKRCILPEIYPLLSLFYLLGRHNRDIALEELCPPHQPRRCLWVRSGAAPVGDTIPLSFYRFVGPLGHHIASEDVCPPRLPWRSPWVRSGASPVWSRKFTPSSSSVSLQVQTGAAPVYLPLLGKRTAR